MNTKAMRDLFGALKGKISALDLNELEREETKAERQHAELENYGREHFRGKRHVLLIK